MKKFMFFSILMVLLVAPAFLLSQQKGDMIVVVETEEIQTTYEYYNAASDVTEQIPYEAILEPGCILVVLDHETKGKCALLWISYEPPECESPKSKISPTTFPALKRFPIKEERFKELKKKFEETLKMAEKYQEIKQKQKIIKELQKKHNAIE